MTGSEITHSGTERADTLWTGLNNTDRADSTGTDNADTDGQWALRPGRTLRTRRTLRKWRTLQKRHTLRAGQALRHGGQAGIADRQTIQTG